jgi:hypothetical protein
MLLTLLFTTIKLAHRFTRNIRGNIFPFSRVAVFKYRLATPHVLFVMCVSHGSEHVGFTVDFKQ